jgi:polysaccharide export outer membrane protein
MMSDHMKFTYCAVAAVVSILGLIGAPSVLAQVQPAASTSGATATETGVSLPSGYVIGPEDVLGVLFWRDEDMSGDTTVRPDGMITLPLVGDVRAAGMSPDALKAVIEKESARFLTEPTVTVVVREIHSRQVFITGEVATPGEYPLTGPRTVMQLIALAGGLNEYADKNGITIMRLENGKQRVFRFRYDDVARGKSLEQNILLQPGDTVVVP